MKFYGKAEQAANQVLELFRHPNRLPEAIAPIFIRRDDDVPCRSWSWSNQILTALAGTFDARGFRQWNQVNRHVKKGAKAFNILAPCSKTMTQRDKETGQDKESVILFGFKSVPVFRFADTEGEALHNSDDDAQKFIDSLPLLGVARAWNLSVESYNGRKESALGWYRGGSGIALGVENLSTWTHELIHAADDRLGKLGGSAKVDREVVAELGGAVLLQCIGQPVDSDLGGCWSYIQSWCEHGKIHPLSACQKLLKRVCECVSLILDTADSLELRRAVA